MSSNHRVAGTLVLTLLLLVLPLQAHDRQAAREAFRRALSYHEALLGRDESQRTLKEYSRALFLYRTVVDEDPTYGACDDALYSIATLYEEMARRFQQDTYRQRAIYYYEFVAREYPLTKHRRPALERAADLKAPKPAPRQEASTPSPAAPQRRPEVPDPSLAGVQDVRYWSNEDYTRVVIELDREVGFNKQILSDPDRIYFDLQGVHLDRSFQEKKYPVNDLFIQQLRVAQNRPGVVRVVLDFEEISSHTVFALYDPFRIVIDTRGGRRSPEDRQATAESPESTPEVAASASAILMPSSPVVPASNLDGDRSLTRVLGLKVSRVVIDPGHGGKDTGTVGPSGLREKDLVLSVSLKLKALLEQRLGTEVVLTRDSDRFVPLDERTAIANQVRADLFVSIHANSSNHRTVTGIETFFLNFTSNSDEREVASRENAGSQKNIRDLENLLRQIALGDFNEESQDLAQTVQTGLHSALGKHRPLPNRGVKKAPFIVLINLNMPGILTEIEFISNPEAETYLKNDSGQMQVAEGLFLGIKEYLNSLGVVPPTAQASASEVEPPAED